MKKLLAILCGIGFCFRRPVLRDEAAGALRQKQYAAGTG